MEIQKSEKTPDGIHLKNICTKFEVNPSILKVSKFGETDSDRQTDGLTKRKHNTLRLRGCIKMTVTCIEYTKECLHQVLIHWQLLRWVYSLCKQLDPYASLAWTFTSSTSKTTKF